MFSAVLGVSRHKQRLIPLISRTSSYSFRLQSSSIPDRPLVEADESNTGNLASHEQPKQTRFKTERIDRTTPFYELVDDTDLEYIKAKQFKKKPSKHTKEKPSKKQNTKFSTSEDDSKSTAPQDKRETKPPFKSKGLVSKNRPLKSLLPNKPSKATHEHNHSSNPSFERTKHAPHGKAKKPQGPPPLSLEAQKVLRAFNSKTGKIDPASATKHCIELSKIPEARVLFDTHLLKDSLGLKDLLISELTPVAGELSRDPTAAIVIQLCIETANFSQRSKILEEVIENCKDDTSILASVLYIIKDGIRHGTSADVHLCAEYVKRHIVEIVLEPQNMFVVTELMERASPSIASGLVRELMSPEGCNKTYFTARTQKLSKNLLEFHGEELQPFQMLCFNNAGYYFVGKLFDTAEDKEVREIIDFVTPKVLKFAFDGSATFIIEKIWEIGSIEQKKAIYKEIINPTRENKAYFELMAKEMQNVSEPLRKHPYLLLSQHYIGTYVAQMIFKSRSDIEAKELSDLILQNYLYMATNPTASFVAKLMTGRANDKEVRKLMDVFLSPAGLNLELLKRKEGEVYPPPTPFTLLIQEKYTVYILMSLMNKLRGKNLDILIKMCKEHEVLLCRNDIGKLLATHVNKIIAKKKQLKAERLDLYQ